MQKPLPGQPRSLLRKARSFSYTRFTSHISPFWGRRDHNAVLKESGKQASAALREFINRMRMEFGDSAPNFEISLPNAEPHDAIHSEIAWLQPDLLAVGTDNRSGIAHAVIRSVAEQLLAD